LVNHLFFNNSKDKKGQMREEELVWKGREKAAGVSEAPGKPPTACYSTNQSNVC
jgi:hypothetical protein